MPFYAVHRMECAFDKIDDALDAFEERHAATFDAADKVFESFGNRVESLADYIFNETASESEEERRQGRPFSPQQLEEAQAVVADFCQDYAEARVVPTEEELHSFWTRCSLLYGCVLSPAPLGTALAEQLTRSPGRGEAEEAWQPQLRALHGLEHLGHQGAVGKEIAADVARRAGGALRRLASGQRCGEEASRLVRVLIEEDGDQRNYV